jgi:C-terminal processing protease CtpA/Prc
MSASIVTESSYSVNIDKKEGDKIGVSFVTKDDGAIVIANVKPDGLASKTDMKDGDRLVSINGKSLDGFDSQSAAKALRNSSGPIEIVLEKDMDANDANGAPPAQAPVETVENEKEDGADNNNCWECIVQ